MQHTKSIKNLSELNWICQNNDRLGESLIRLLKKFNLAKIGKILLEGKSKGVCPKQIFMTLFLFPFFGIKNINSWMRSGFCGDTESKKDVYYELINNPKIDWRKIVSLFTRGFVKTVEKHSEEKVVDSPKCLIVDDSLLDKKGKKMEFMGKVFDHCTHTYRLGIKLLTLGWWDSKSFIPLDFSIHNEPGKKNNRGLKPCELKEQYSKERPLDCTSVKRIAELAVNKIEQGVKMISWAIKKGFVPQYVLADSWFITDGFIKAILSLRTKKTGVIHVLGLMKSNRKIEYNGKTHHADLLPRLLTKNIKKCSKLKCQYLSVKIIYKDTPVKAFFIKMNGQENWKLLITTDERLTFIKAMKYYQIRWSIEVFFKDAKQNLMLGKCQSNDFDAHLATTSLAFMHYIVLALGKRFESYETMGEVFRAFKDKLLEQTLYQKVWALLVGLYKNILALLGVQWDMFVKSFIENDEVKNLLSDYANIFSSGGQKRKLDFTVF